MLNGEESTYWSVICSTAAEWSKLTKSFRQTTDKNEKYLYATLSSDFLPEIPSMIVHKVRKTFLYFNPDIATNDVCHVIMTKT